MKIDGSLQGLNYKWRANLSFHDIFRFLIETIYSFKFSKIKLSLQKLYSAKTINLSYLYRVKYLLNNLSNELRIFPKTDRHSPPDKTGIKITFTLPTKQRLPLCAVQGHYLVSMVHHGSIPWHSVNDSLLRKSPCREFFFSKHSPSP